MCASIFIELGHQKWIWTAGEGGGGGGYFWSVSYVIGEKIRRIGKIWAEKNRYRYNHILDKLDAKEPQLTHGYREKRGNDVVLTLYCGCVFVFISDDNNTFYADTGSTICLLS